MQSINFSIHSSKILNLFPSFKSVFSPEKVSLVALPVLAGLVVGLGLTAVSGSALLGGVAGLGVGVVVLKVLEKPGLISITPDGQGSRLPELETNQAPTGISLNTSGRAALRADAVYRSTYQGQLIGIEDTGYIGSGHLRLDDSYGTPGVHRAGSLALDRQFYENRKAKVLREVAPYAHNTESKAAYLDLFNSSVFTDNARLGWTDTIEGLIDTHNRFRDIMKKRFSKQLSIVILGGGPSGLAAAIAFYRQGFSVFLFGKRLESAEENAFSSLSQPFSMIPYCYSFLNSLGVSPVTLCEAFGGVVEGVNEKERIENAIKALITLPSEKKANEKSGLGFAAKYIPGAASLPMAKLQELIFRIVKDINSSNPMDLQMFFDLECTGSIKDSMTKKHTLSFVRAGSDLVLKLFPDVVYNVAGGKINDILEMPFVSIVGEGPAPKYYGMGAYFTPLQPEEEAPREQRLSRAIRVFSSEKTFQEIDPDPIYCNVELSEEEFRSTDLQRQIISEIEHDVQVRFKGKAFPIAITLKRVQTAAMEFSPLAGRFTLLQRLPQFIFCGGEALLNRDFIRAAGVDFSFLGLIRLNKIFTSWMRQIDLQTNKDGNWLGYHIENSSWKEGLIQPYNETAELLQRQSAQTILNLFARELVIPEAG